jgi:hypothetical protein
LRHDWNSLLQDNMGDEDTVLFKHITETYFPHADHMLEYMKTFVAKHELPIFYNHDVTRIARSDGKGRFIVTYNEGKVVTCDVLLVATGKVPNRPPPRVGAELLDYYDTMSVNASEYDGKEVLIMGSGNSGLETLDGIEEFGGHTHIAIRSHLVYSYESHYVGDVRAVNLGLWDKYQLKSLDAIMSYSSGETSGVGDLHLKKKGDRIFLELENMRRVAEGNVQNVDKEFTSAGNHAVRRGYQKIIGCFGFKPDVSIFDESAAPRIAFSGKFPVVTSMYESSNVQHMYFIGALMHSRDYGKSSGGFIHGFRYLVRTVVQYLRQRYAGVTYPRHTISVRYDKATNKVDASAVVTSIVKRVNSASSLYQMFGVLADLYILQPRSQIVVLHDVPLDALRSGLPHNFTKVGDRYLTVDLEYGEDFQGMGVMMHRRQKVTAQVKRRRQLLMPWEEDPDEEYKRRFIPSRNWLWPYEAAKEMRPKEEAHRSAIRRQEFSAEMLHAKEQNVFLEDDSKYKDRNNFLHPVIRVWRRVTTQQTPVLIDEFHVMVDFLTDWTLEEYIHPLRDFLEKHLGDFLDETRRLSGTDEL